jgi:predicted GNAT family acetyltransferase
MYIYGGSQFFWFPGATPFETLVENDQKEQPLSKPNITIAANPLDNPIWSALTSRQAHLALGGRLAKRYPPDMATVAAVVSPERAALAELATLIENNEAVYLTGIELNDIESQLPSSLKVKHRTSVVQMVYLRPVGVPESETDISILSEADVPEMLTLTSRAYPLLARTYQMGKYLGIRQQGQLVAMVGERMWLDGYREISTVCTHPDFQGRDYARQLVSRLVNDNLSEGNTPFLHVMDDNKRAKSIYEGLGFVERRHMPLIIVQRAASGSNY